MNTKLGNEKICAVCKAPGRCVGFSTICCKSCSVFYRRSYKLRHILKCKREGNCNLEGELRNVCRACRLKSCRDLGLRMVGKNLIVQCNGYPPDDIPDDEPSTSTQQKDNVPDEPYANQFSNLKLDSQMANNTQNNIPQQPIHTMDTLPGQMFPELRRLVEAFVSLENNQRVVSSLHQQKQIQAYESIYINKCTQYLLETATLQLFGQLIEKFLFDCSLNAEQMKCVLKALPLQLASAHKAELTNRVFPNVGDLRLAFFVGYHLDIEKLEYFLDHPDREEFERIKTVAWPLIHKRWIAAERCRQLRPSTIEWCCFLGVLLFEELSRLGIKNDTIVQKQNALYAEFFQYLLSNYQDPSVVTARIVKTVSFTHEISIVCAAHDDMYTIVDLFFPKLRNSGWNSKPEIAGVSLKREQK